MISNECSDLVQVYIRWLGQKMSIQDIDGVCEITTPFVDRHNDYLQIYIKRSKEGFTLTDDGYIIRDLRLSGCEFTTEKRRQMLNAVLNGFGVRLQGEELIVEARPDNFPQKKHNLIQAMLAINDLFVMAAPMVMSIFREDVETYLRAHDIRFTPSVKFTGKSGLDNSFDFVIPASRVKPERVLRAINRPDRQSITTLIFAWTDTKKVRLPESTAYAVLNDTERPLNPDLINALRRYDVKDILWSCRDEHIQELAA